MSDPQDDVDFYATDDIPADDATDEVWQAWQIQSKASADWCLAVIKRSEAEIADAKEIAQQRVQRAMDQLAEVERREQFTITRMEGKLRDWYEKFLVPEGLVNDKKKTYSNLENGTVGKRAGGLKLVVDDAAAVADAFREHELFAEFVKVEESVKVAALKAAFPAVEGKSDVFIETGEAIPGVRYERSDESFVVKTK